MASSRPLNQRPSIPHQPLDTPTLGSGGVYTIACATAIHAPLTTVLTALLDTRTYPSWNRFVPSVAIARQPASPSPSPSPAPSCLAGTDLIGREGTLQLGTELVLNVHLGPEASCKKTTAPLVLSVLEDFEHRGHRGVRVAWRTGGWTPGFVLRCERVQELLEVGDGVVEYRCWETMYGLLASTVRWSVGKELLWGFGAWMDGLKEYSEKQT